MYQAIDYRYELDKSSRKFICPSCGQKRFVRYRSVETGEYLPDHLGRCDRENNCGHHEKPGSEIEAAKSLLNDFNGNSDKIYNPVIKPIDFIPFELVKRSMVGYDQSNFAKFIIDSFGETAGKNLLLKYLIGRSKEHEGKAAMFWKIDIDENVRTGKIIAYNDRTGKRLKDVLKNKRGENIDARMIHFDLKKDFNYYGCFFGEHLIAEFPERPIAVVEGEKTAVICSFFMPQFNWIASGALHGLKWHDYAVYKIFKNKEVVMFPDFGNPDGKGKTPFMHWQEIANEISNKISCHIRVSSLLEKKLKAEDRDKGLDLADILLKRDENTGIVVTAEGYPAIWDCKDEYC